MKYNDLYDLVKAEKIAVVVLDGNPPKDGYLIQANSNTHIAKADASPVGDAEAFDTFVDKLVADAQTYDAKYLLLIDGNQIVGHPADYIENRTFALGWAGASDFEYVYDISKKRLIALSNKIIEGFFRGPVEKIEDKAKSTKGKK